MNEASTRSTLGAAIKARRRQLGWSQEELAARVAARGDVAFRQTDVSRLERGKVGLPRCQRLAHIAAVLGYSPGELLALSGWADERVAPSTDQPAAPVGPPVVAVSGSSLPKAPVVSPAETRLTAELARLSELMAQSAAIRGRSREVLQQCETTRALYDGVIWMRGRQERKRPMG